MEFLFCTPKRLWGISLKGRAENRNSNKRDAQVCRLNRPPNKLLGAALKGHTFRCVVIGPYVIVSARRPQADEPSAFDFFGSVRKQTAHL